MVSIVAARDHFRAARNENIILRGPDVGEECVDLAAQRVCLAAQVIRCG
jgi:hypothetical protein